MTATAPMKITAPLPYFGGKRTMAPAIVAELGEHNAYDEVFAGSAAVLFAKPPCAMETINDLHGDAVNVAMVLASPRWHELHAAVDRILLCEDYLRSIQPGFSQDWDAPSDITQVRDVDIVRATMYLALSWIGRNGVSGTERVNYQPAIRWTQGGGSPGIRWRSAVDSVPAWHDRLKGVFIMRRDAFEILGKLADEPGRAIYVDPPYFKATRGNGTGSRYLYDFNESADPLFGMGDDHARLAGVLSRFKQARVVVSYYDHPRLAELYPGWTKRLMYRQKNLHVQNRRGMAPCTAPEVLLINGPSLSRAEEVVE